MLNQGCKKPWFFFGRGGVYCALFLFVCFLVVLGGFIGFLKFCACDTTFWSDSIVLLYIVTPNI
jgi:hypothetical protein